MPVYFGSVKFFRHLILTVAALLIIIPFILAAVFAAKNAKLKKQVDELTAKVAELEKKAVQPSNPEPPNTDPPPPDTDPPPNTENTEKQTETEPPDTDVPAEPLPEYAALYPDLYANAVVGEPYVNDQNTVYLTFDDGPSAYTDDILRYLRDGGVKATFFAIPDENSAERLNRILSEGHALGVHTKSHDYKKIYASVEAYLADFKEAYDLIYEQTGYKPDIFRFPGGSKNDYNALVYDDIIAEMTRRGFIYFDWNVDSRDAMGAGWSEIRDTVLKEVGEAMAKTGVESNRAVVLMHDRPGGQNTVLVLEDIIAALKDSPNGYVFAKLDKNVRPLIF